jgi:hypothetical protein
MKAGPPAAPVDCPTLRNQSHRGVDRVIPQSEWRNWAARRKRRRMTALRTNDAARHP